MINKEEKERRERADKQVLTNRQVQAINDFTGNGRFNAAQQAAILEAIKIAMNPEKYSDEAAPVGPAVDEAAVAEAKAKRDAELVRQAQEAGAVINSAEPALNVLNQGNVDRVAETTAATVAARAQAQADAEAGRVAVTPTDTRAASAKQEVKKAK